METIYTTLDTLYSLTAIAGLAYLAYEFVAGLMNRQHPTDTQPTKEDTPASTPTPNPKSVGAAARDLSRLGIRELRILARDRGVRGAARLTKSQCLAALS